MFRKQLGVLLLFGLLCAAGLVLATRLGIQLYPRTSRPAVTSTIRHQGYSAIAFSQEFGDMIEAQLMGVPGADRLELRYGSNSSTFTITFNWDVDAETALRDAESALEQIESRLPSELGGVSRVRFSTGENAGYLMLGISSDSVSAEDLYRMATGSLESSLSQVPDVEMIEILSVERLNVDIELRQQDMLQYGITILDVNQALARGSGIQSVGSVREGQSALSVHVTAENRSLLDIGELVVAESGGGRVRLADVADISIGHTIPASTFVVQGSRGIQLIATPIDGGNIRSMSQEILRRVHQARASGDLPEDAEITMLLDPADYINRSIANVIQAAVLGAGLAMLVVFLALGKLRNTLLIGVSLPVTLILSFVLLYLFEVSLNLISLGGMALAVGMIVDSSIVVIENIHRFRHEEKHTDDSDHLQDLIIRAVRQVRAPIIASTLTSILVFLPITLTAPLTNAILGEQSLVVVFALSVSLLVALTLVPLIAFMVYNRRLQMVIGASGQSPSGGVIFARTRSISAHVTGRLEKAYLRCLAPIISDRRKAVTVLSAAAVACAAAAVLLLPGIPREILSPPTSDRMIVFVRPTADVDSTMIVEQKFPEMTRQIENELGSKVTNIYGEVRGRFNRLFVVLENSRDADYISDRLEAMFVSDNDWYYNVFSWDPAALPLPRTNDLQISVDGPDETEVVALLERVRDVTAETGLYPRLTTMPATNYTEELVMHPRQEVIDSFPGYSQSQLVSIMQRALSGTQSVEYQHEGSTVQVRAAYPEDVLEGRGQFENFLLPFEQSAVPIKHFFDFSTAANVAQIASEDGQQIFRLYGNLPRGSGAAERSAEELKLRSILADEIDIPAGYSLTFDNPQQELDDAIQSLFFSLLLSVALIYLLLTFQFNSFGAPLVILLSIPLGLLGSIVSLSVFDSTLSLNSLLGAILLSGVVVNNAIILLDFYLHELNRYPTRTAALLETARVRFRPILITTLTTIAGMLPIAIGMGEGANVIQPLGIAVSGGLAVSTVMTMFVVPAVLSLVRLRPKTP